jgi:hypothetical protein
VPSVLSEILEKQDLLETLEMPVQPERLDQRDQLDDLDQQVSSEALE